jgi:hypothetical protein
MKQVDNVICECSLSSITIHLLSLMLAVHILFMLIAVNINRTYGVKYMKFESLRTVLLNAAFLHYHINTKLNSSVVVGRNNNKGNWFNSLNLPELLLSIIVNPVEYLHNSSRN